MTNRSWMAETKNQGGTCFSKKTLLRLAPSSLWLASPFFRQVRSPPLQTRSLNSCRRHRTRVTLTAAAPAAQTAPDRSARVSQLARPLAAPGRPAGPSRPAQAREAVTACNRAHLNGPPPRTGGTDCEPPARKKKTQVNKIRPLLHPQTGPLPVLPPCGAGRLLACAGARCVVWAWWWGLAAPAPPPL